MQLPPVLAFGELIELFGLSRTRVKYLTDLPAFPRPIAVLGVGKIWSSQDVIRFCTETGRTVHPVHRPVG